MHPRRSANRRRLLPCGAKPPSGNSAPAGHALDGAAPASARHLTRCCHAGEQHGHCTLAMPRRRGVFFPLRRWMRTSDAPCSASRTPGHPDSFEEPGPIPPPSRQRKRRMPAQSAFPRQVLPREALLAQFPPSFFGSPPPISRLSHQRSGFRCAFASRRSRAERLDPSSIPRTLRPWARVATHRLSTSAIDANREHNRGRPEPHTTAAVIAHR